MLNVLFTFSPTVKVVQSSRLHHPPPDDANKPQDNNDDDNDNGDNGDGDKDNGDNGDDYDFVPQLRDSFRLFEEWRRLRPNNILTQSLPFANI